MDFAVTEAAFIIVRILQRYPSIRLLEGEKVDLVGVEKQTMTLVLQITGVVRLNLGRRSEMVILTSRLAQVGESSCYNTPPAGLWN